jgi:hypothetical protein
MRSPSVLAIIRNTEVYSTGKIQNFGMLQVLTAVLYISEVRIYCFIITLCKTKAVSNKNNAVISTGTSFN